MIGLSDPTWHGDVNCFSRSGANPGKCEAMSPPLMVTFAAATPGNENHHELRRIIAARMPRMASAQPPHAAARAAERTILLHGENEILAATRMESTKRREERPQDHLVEPHPANQNSREEGAQPASKPFHRRPASFSSLRASCR